MRNPERVAAGQRRKPSLEQLPVPCRDPWFSAGYWIRRLLHSLQNHRSWNCSIPFWNSNGHSVGQPLPTACSVMRPWVSVLKDLAPARF